jgi:glycosyltransferase involved in cell wall biosynthesis
MACGAFPIAGDIPSVREWITDGENGILVDQRSPRSIAEGILRALADDPLRAAAAHGNPIQVADSVSYESVMRRAEEFYDAVIAFKRKAPRSISAKLEHATSAS